MNASALYDAGQLQAAIETQIQEVRSNPADSSKRLFLFDLLAFSGELDRAQRQIEAIATENVQEQAAIQSYRRLLDSERTRRQVFAGNGLPKFLMPQPEHVKYRLEAVAHLAKGRLADAVEALAKAAELTPALKGTLNGEPFELMIDCDDLFGTVIEVMGNGEYFWVPLEQVESITLNDPKFPIDILWRPASLETIQSRGEVFLPALYPGSHGNADDQIRLARLTDWIAPENGPVQGVGVHTYLADERDVSLLEWRDLVFEVAAEPPGVEVVEPSDAGAESGQ